MVRVLESFLPGYWLTLRWYQCQTRHKNWVFAITYGTQTFVGNTPTGQDLTPPPHLLLLSLLLPSSTSTSHSHPSPLCHTPYNLYPYPYLSPTYPNVQHVAINRSRFHTKIGNVTDYSCLDESPWLEWPLFYPTFFSLVCDSFVKETEQRGLM